LLLEATGLRTSVGAQCLITQPGQKPVLAEVVGFSGDRAFLMPAGDVQGLSSGARVMPTSPYVAAPQLEDAGAVRLPQRVAVDRFAPGQLLLPLGDGLLGRVVDAQGLPMDRRGP